MEPGSLGFTDRFLHDVDERSDVMVDDGLPFGDAPDEGGIYLGGALAARRRVRKWNHAELRPCLHSQKLDLEPYAEARLVGEDRRHLGH